MQRLDHAGRGAEERKEEMYIRHRAPNNVVAQGGLEKGLIGLVIGLPLTHSYRYGSFAVFVVDIPYPD